MSRVLHVIPAFLPATRWGGPVFSTSAICDYIVRNSAHDIVVLTTDAAVPDSRENLLLPRNPVQFDAGYTVCYARRTFGQSGSLELLRRLPTAVKNADLVHLSMTYSFPTIPTLLLCKLFAKPVIWSPRGAIQATEEWGSVSNRRIKTAFERLARMVMPRRTVLHTTAPAEARATARRLPGYDIEVIGNAVAIDAPRTTARITRSDGAFRLLFLSRLHPKKGLETLFDALAQLPTHITLEVAGSGPDAYQSALAAQVSALGLDTRVRFLGHVDGTDKAEAFARADLFVLPTQSENFGVAIAESLAAGLPVITTSAAPWEGLETHHAGLWIEEGLTPLLNAIRKADALPPAELRAMGERGYEWMCGEFSSEAVGQKMCALYERLLRDRRK